MAEQERSAAVQPALSLCGSVFENPLMESRFVREDGEDVLVVSSLNSNKSYAERRCLEEVAKLERGGGGGVTGSVKERAEEIRDSVRVISELEESQGAIDYLNLEKDVRQINEEIKAGQQQIQQMLAEQQARIALIKYLKGL